MSTFQRAATTAASAASAMSATSAIKTETNHNLLVETHPDNSTAQKKKKRNFRPHKTKRLLETYRTIKIKVPQKNGSAR